MRGAALGVVLLAASHTAAAGLFSDDEAHRRIEALQQENIQLQQKLRSLDERVTKLDAMLRAQGMLDLLQSVEAMKNEMAKLTTLADAFYDELQDMYSAEKQLVKAIPKMAKAGT